MRIEAFGFHPHAKGTLADYADPALADAGIRIFDCPVYCKEGRWFVGFPNKQFTTRQGEVRWQAFIEFNDVEAKNAFQKAALAALRWRFPNTFPADLGVAGGVRQPCHGRSLHVCAMQSSILGSPGRPAAGISKMESDMTKSIVKSTGEFGALAAELAELAKEGKGGRDRVASWRDQDALARGNGLCPFSGA
jgi:hypothetical protein